MQSPREARAAVVRAWDTLPPVAKMEIRAVAPELAQALDGLVVAVAALVDALRSGLDEPAVMAVEVDPAEYARLREVVRAALDQGNPDCGFFSIDHDDAARLRDLVGGA